MVDICFNRTKNGEINAHNIIKEFSNIEKTIQLAIDEGRNKEAREMIATLSSEITNLSTHLSPFDKERSQQKINKLLKLANNRSMFSERFKFKKMPHLIHVTKEPHISLNLTSSKAGLDALKLFEPESEVLRNKKIVINMSQTHYCSLKNCHVTIDPAASILQSSALSISQVESTYIFLKNVPFLQGSILIEKANDCSIIIICSKASDIQIRLHELVNCKISILKEDTEKQIVVIEKCSHCEFDERVRHRLIIHDLSNLGFGDLASNSYSFTTWASE